MDGAPRWVREWGATAPAAARGGVPCRRASLARHVFPAVRKWLSQWPAARPDESYRVPTRPCVEFERKYMFNHSQCGVSTVVPRRCVS